MGNYGNTIDRWYRRAAIVLWPAEHTFVVHAQASAAWALRRLHERIEEGDQATARTLAKTLIPFWDNTVRGGESAMVATAALRVASGLDDAPLATMLVRPLRLETLTPREMPALAELADHYGQLVDSRTARHLVLRAALVDGRARRVDRRRCHRCAKPSRQLASRPHGACSRGHGPGLTARSPRRVELPAPSRREEELGRLVAPLRAFLAAAAETEDLDLVQTAVPALCGEHSDTLLPTLVQVLRMAQATATMHARSATGPRCLTSRCARSLSR